MPRNGSYPTSYRSPARGPQGALGRFWSDERGYLGPAGPLPQQLSPNPWRPVPARPFGRPIPVGPFVPANPNNPLGPPDIDLPLPPAISPGSLSAELIVARFAPWALLGLQLYDLMRPGQTPIRPIIPGAWNTCGTPGYPGPPYRNQEHWSFQAGPTLCFLLPAGGQAVTNVDNAPASNLTAMWHLWGPNEALLPTVRYFFDVQYWTNTPNAGLEAKATTGVAPISLPHELLPYVGPAVLVNPLPVAPPVGSTPTVFQQRGDLIDLEPAVAPAPKPGPLGVSHVPRMPDTRPRPREREHKAAGSAARGFQILSQIGSWNSLIHALHRSLPKACRARGRNTGAQIAAIYQHASCLELGAAAWELSNFWVRYKFAGWSYGRIQRFMLRMDPSGGTFRQFMTFYDMREHFGLDKAPLPRPRRRPARDNRKCPGC